jgi:hypothetical protein
VGDLAYGRFTYWSESGAVEVFLLLGVVWAVVLVPPWLQSRRELRPMASVRSFRSQLWSLQRATPHYGDDAYTGWGDDGWGGEPAEGLVDVESEGAGMHAFATDRSREVAGTMAAGVAAGPAGAVVRRPPATPPRRMAGPAGALARRSLGYRRRRRVLAVLALAAVAGAAPALLLGGPWQVAEAVAGGLLLTYLGLLVRRGRREAERAETVRYPTPIQAPPPAVVIIGSGAAR